MIPTLFRAKAIMIKTEPVRNLRPGSVAYAVASQAHYRQHVPLRERIAQEIERSGPMKFSRFMHLALYDADEGFYSSGGQAGRRRGDFITSVETGPLFGAVVARYIDELWHRLDRPAELRVVEAGAGVGTLYRTVHKAQPECLDALTWTLVEQSAHLRSHHQSLPGRAWSSQASLPNEHQHLVLANELLDNIPFDIAERCDGGWAAVKVAGDPSAASGFAFSTGPPDATLVELAGLAPDAAIGAQVPVMEQARSWVAAARAVADKVVLFDYTASTPELVRRRRDGWLRSYQAQQRGDDPLLQPGVWDITADVAWDQLGPELGRTTQAEWLQRWGIVELVEQAKITWTERAAIGDLQAMIARSAITEAEALTSTDGLGGFSVLEWV